MADDDRPKMHRLGNPEPELKRFHPLSGTADADTPNEQTWGDSIPSGGTPGGRRWPLVGAAVLAVAALAALFFVSRRHAGEPPVKTPPVTAAPLTAEQKKAAAEETLRAFLAATTTDDRMAHVLEPERLRPALEEYYARADAPGLELARFEEMHFILLNSHPWCWIKFADSESRSHLAGLKQTKGGYRIDWETLVAYGERSWDSLLREKPNEPVQMRVYLSHVAYYNFKYGDAEKYLSFKVEGRDPGEVIYGYVERGSLVYRQLLAVVAPGTRQPANVRLRFEPDAGADNLAVIHEVIHRQWTAPSVSAAEEL